MSTTKAYLSDDRGVLLTEAAGKGIGAQSKASAVYEVVEHAAFRYLLPGQRAVWDRRLLEPADIEDIDYLYRYARFAGDDVQPVHRFYRLNERGLDEKDVLYYPAIVCDVSLPLERHFGRLLPLSSYASNTGIASGANTHDAFVHATNELIERDAESKFLLDVSMGAPSWTVVELDDEDHLSPLFHELTGGYGGRGSLYSLSTVAGYAFCAQAWVPDGHAELGFGASMYPDVALERALTELQQVQHARRVDETWEKEGGERPSNLDRFPNMKNIASRIFPRLDGHRISLRTLMREALPAGGGSAMSAIEQAGFKVYGRVIWTDESSGISVVQVVIPGFEGLNNLIFCRPIVTSGRLRTRASLSHLLAGKI
ncbi:YcaO-like family protein [Arthrobacter sp. RAF14]|uniref:YcaO-like family protein n=1 Tax=Arthrobacter sp. RAF14 TaxID=3233051 RepID=UPI003F9048A4